MKGKVNKKKVIVLISLVVLLAGVAVLNYFLTVKGLQNKDNQQVNASKDTPTFFSTYRTDRTSTREQEVLYLEQLIAASTTDEATKAQANESYLALVKSMETETCLEGLIKSYGFEDCVVTISNDNVNIVVKDQELTVEEAAQILSIVTSETDYKAADVIIIPYI